MKNLFYSLLIYLDSANETDTNYSIALYMVNHIHDIANMGISKLANECFVSPATISRFCRTIGFENFAHLKQECLSFDSDDRRYKNLIHIPVEQMKENPQSCTIEYCKQVSEGVELLSQHLDWKVVDEVLKLIHDSKQVAFFGTQFSQNCALHLQTDLLMLDKVTMVHQGSERQGECAKSLGEDDMAIILSVTGNYFNGYGKKVYSHLKKSKAKTVLITNREYLKNEYHVDYVIKIGDQTNERIGKHNLLTTVELMALRYYAFYCDK